MKKIDLYVTGQQQKQYNKPVGADGPSWVVYAGLINYSVIRTAAQRGR